MNAPASDVCKCGHAIGKHACHHTEDGDKPGPSRIYCDCKSFDAAPEAPEDAQWLDAKKVTAKTGLWWHARRIGDNWEVDLIAFNSCNSDHVTYVMLGIWTMRRDLVLLCPATSPTPPAPPPPAPPPPAPPPPAPLPSSKQVTLTARVLHLDGEFCWRAQIYANNITAVVDGTCRDTAEECAEWVREKYGIEPVVEGSER